MLPGVCAGAGVVVVVLGVFVLLEVLEELGESDVLFEVEEELDDVEGLSLFGEEGD